MVPPVPAAAQATTALILVTVMEYAVLATEVVNLHLVVAVRLKQPQAKILLRPAQPDIQEKRMAGALLGRAVHQVMTASTPVLTVCVGLHHR